jgi:tetratricopeptide (TPR) repeat protein
MGVAYERAQVLYQQERYAQAQLEFERDLADDPRKSATVAMIAMCLTNQNNIAKARTTAEEAIALDPGNGFAHYSLAWALYKDDKYVTRRGFHFAANAETLKAQRFRLVESALLEALRLQPRNPGYHSLLAFTRLARSNSRGALESANDCLAINPHHSDGHRAAALALARLGQVAQAQDASANAVSAQPLGPETHLTRAFMLLRHAQPEQALPHFREAVRLEPGSGPAQRGLLECLRMNWPVYRWRARLNHARHMTAILFAATLLALDVTIVSHNANAKTSQVWNAASLCWLLGSGAVFAWLCFSKNLADLTLLRDPLARHMMSVARKWIAWLVAGCVGGSLIAAIAILALSAAGKTCDSVVSSAGMLLGVALVGKIVLVRLERDALRKSA